MNASLDLFSSSNLVEAEVLAVVVEVHCVSSVEVFDSLSKVELGSGSVGDLEAVVGFEHSEAVYEK